VPSPGSGSDLREVEDPRGPPALDACWNVGPEGLVETEGHISQLRRSIGLGETRHGLFGKSQQLLSNLYLKVETPLLFAFSSQEKIA
jgi:hypothetical protein